MAGDGRVRIVVDDSACLQPQVAENLGIVVVPLGVDAENNSVTTSAAAPLPLCAAYARALERSSTQAPDGSGSTDAGVIALHLGKNLSSTWSNAVSAAGVLERVVVVDTDTIGAGVGAAAIAAAKAARNFATLEECAAVAQDVLNRYRLWLYVPSLDSLHKGGRISTGQAMLAAVLAMKPIFGIVNGSLAPVAKCRTSTKVLERMVQMAVHQVEHSDSGTIAPHVLIHHADGGSTVEQLRSMLADALPKNTKFRILDFPPSLRAHTGPGAIALGVISSDVPVDLDAIIGAETLKVVSQAEAISGQQDNDKPADNAKLGENEELSDNEHLPENIEPGEADDIAEPPVPLHLRRPLKNVKFGRGGVENRIVFTNEEGVPLFTTVAAKLPSWSANRQAALEKADQFAKAIADLARRDHSDPEGARFGDYDGSESTTEAEQARFEDQ